MIMFQLSLPAGPLAQGTEKLAPGMRNPATSPSPQYHTDARLFRDRERGNPPPPLYLSFSHFYFPLSRRDVELFFILRHRNYFAFAQFCAVIKRPIHLCTYIPISHLQTYLVTKSDFKRRSKPSDGSASGFCTYKKCHRRLGLFFVNFLPPLTDAFQIVVVTEYADKELYEILGKAGRLSEERAQVIACDLVSALFYLHSNRVLHRFEERQRADVPGSRCRIARPEYRSSCTSFQRPEAPECSTRS